MQNRIDQAPSVQCERTVQSYRYRDSVVIPIVIPYYRNYLYSTLNLPYMIGLIKSSRSYFTANEKVRSREPMEPDPLPCLTS
jgi:hypothetical protein